jgi:hypothetical protein
MKRLATVIFKFMQMISQNSTKPNGSSEDVLCSAKLRFFVCLRGRIGKVARLWLLFTISQWAQVQFPGRAQSTKPSIPLGSVNW